MFSCLHACEVASAIADVKGRDERLVGALDIHNCSGCDWQLGDEGFHLFYKEVKEIACFGKITVDESFFMG